MIIRVISNNKNMELKLKGSEKDSVSNSLPNT